jgi:calcineurin-like phosphoesterase family protein
MTQNNTNYKDKQFIPLPDPKGTKPDVVGKMIELSNQPREFVIGDSHFYDPDIILFNDRPFVTVEEMNEYMTKQWNSVVEGNDTVFMLGDFFDFNHCDENDVRNIVDRLNGVIVLIVGNHDMPHLDWLANAGIKIIEYPILKDGFWLMSHEPLFVAEAAPYANIFAHVHLNPMYKTVSSRSFCASAERHDYVPVLLSDIKKMVRQAATKRTQFKPGNNVKIIGESNGKDDF